MKNYDIARILERIADMLELKGENLYKVRAYRQVASLIDGLTEDVEQIARRNELLELPGVGAGISARIKEIVETGNSPLYERLKEEVPEGVLELLELPGVGPDKIRKAYQGLGVASIDELEVAAREGRLASVPGLAEKTQQRILESIGTYRRRVPRIPLFRAVPYWQSISDALAAGHSVERLAIAGSFRRGADTVGDLNAVAICKDPAVLLQTLAVLPRVARVLESSANRLRVMTNIDLEAEIWIATPENWGAMLLRATGSKAHTEQLQAFARDRGFSLDETGIYSLETGERLEVSAEEEAIYRELGLPWLPPEIREGRGEIEAAAAGRLPRFIRPEDIRGDFHAHTIASDGRNTISDMAESAKSRGYEYLAISDHSKRLTIAHGLDTDELLAQAAYIRQLNSGNEGFRILAGAEVDIRLDGTLDHPDEVLKQLDIVIASIHSGFNQSKEELTSRLISAIRSPHVDIIGHPTGRIVGVREPYELDLQAVFQAAAENRTALEISAFPDRLDLSDEHARAAKAAGAKLAIDTDAHSAEQLDLMRYGVSSALRAWLEPADILNTMPLEEMLGYVGRR